MLNLMLRFHNVSAYLANLHVSFSRKDSWVSRKDAKFAKEAPRISRIDTYLYFIFQAIRCLLSVVRCQVKKDSCKYS